MGPPCGHPAEVPQRGLELLGHFGCGPLLRREHRTRTLKPEQGRVDVGGEDELEGV